MKTIKYVGFYDVDDFPCENRVKSIAAVNKMNYIVSAIKRGGWGVEIISPSWSANSQGFYSRRKTKLADGITIELGPTFGARNNLSKKLRILFSWIWLFFYLLFNTKKNEKVIVYHSIMALPPLYFLIKIKKIRIVLELNEIYQNVSDFSPFLKEMEMKIIRKSKYFILSTDLLQSKIAADSQYLINYGDYRISEEGLKSNSGKIKIVYAGVIDLTKRGAFNAVEVAQYLSEKYEIRIIGFGSEDDLKNLKVLIDKNNNENNCKVYFDGLKKGEDYIKYISSCHIGLSTQSPDNDFNFTSFPSKILSYLSLGLRVISVDVPSIRKSKVGKLLFFYDGSGGKAISTAILKINLDEPYSSKMFLKRLDEDFIKGIRKLFL